jgi:hypothetical protein
MNGRLTIAPHIADASQSMMKTRLAIVLRGSQPAGGV